jgi:conjugal transfer pilus assembly protein TrbC
MLLALKSVNRTFYVVFASLFISNCFAGDSVRPDLQKVYNEALKWSREKLESLPDQSLEMASTGRCIGAVEKLSIKPPCSKKQGEVKLDSSENINAENIKSDSDTKILVFVSFSMPKTSLKALAQEAAMHNAVLIMRGLKNDSFKDTQEAFMDVMVIKTEDYKNPEKNNIQGQGFEINPNLFEEYKIKKVPVFVLLKKRHLELGRLSGNVSLAFAAEKLKEVL